MTSRDFCFWLQGFLELRAGALGTAREGLTVAQTECIARHLALVFEHEIDPSAGEPGLQAALNAIHHPGTKGPGIRFRMSGPFVIRGCHNQSGTICHIDTKEHVCLRHRRPAPLSS